MFLSDKGGRHILKELIKTKYGTQEQFAKVARLQLSTLGYYLSSGKKRSIPTLDKAFRMAKALDISLDELACLLEVVDD